MKQSILLLGIVAVLLVAGCTGQGSVTCSSPNVIVGNTCCLDSNSNGICDKDEAKTTSQTIDLSKIDVSFEPYNLNVYINGKGGPSSQIAHVTIKNNNDAQIGVFLDCVDESGMKANNVQCAEFLAPGANPGNVDGHTSLSMAFQVSSAIIPQSTLGTYTGKISVKVNGYQLQSTTIAEAPITVNVLCAPGCCASGEFVMANCK